MRPLGISGAEGTAGLEECARSGRCRPGELAVSPRREAGGRLHGVRGGAAGARWTGLATITGIPVVCDMMNRRRVTASFFDC